MESRLNLKKALFTLLFVCSSLLVFAQGTGRIVGTISDQKTGETLVGVTVRILESNKAVGTDIDGKYLLSGLTTGKHTLEVVYMTYKTKRITDVEVKAGETTILNVVLEEAASQTLQQVVIVGTFKQESVNSLYAQQKNSALISDGISSEQIKRSPDRNTSDVLKRVSGATIQDNKFVVVRGLSDRYNTALLDGAALPSTEPNRKAFSFDIVPSNLVDNLIINKTATPDLPADFTGGAVQISTKDIPEQNFITVGVGAGYNSVSTFKDFKGTQRNFTDYLGFDNGDRSLPGNFPTTKQVVNRQLTSEQQVAAFKALPQNWNTYDSQALPSQNYQFTIGRVKNLDKGKFGSLLSLTYRNAQNIYTDVVRDYYDYDYRDNVYKFSTSLGALANFAYSSGKNKFTFKNIYNRSYDDQTLDRGGFNKATSNDIKFFAFDLMQKELFKSTIEGTHQVGDVNGKLNWSLSYSHVLNDQPDQRKVNYARNPSDIGTADYVYFANITTSGKENTRLFSRLSENAFAGAVNYSIPVKVFSQSATFKSGLSSQYRDRTFDARFLGMVLNTNASNAAEIRKRSLEQLFAPDTYSSYVLDEIPNDLDSYSANSLNNAGYVMLDQKIGEKSRVVWGARVEHFKVDLTAKVPSAATSVNQNYVDVLPSVNYTYSLNAKTNLRASYYRTLARPEFRELSLGAFYDYEMLANLQGNPNLKRALIDNGDVRLEFYPNAGQILSVSAFYKKFHNAIESFNSDATSSRTITYFNSKQVSVYGLELEARKSLEFISEEPFFKNTTVYANFSWIKSEVDNGESGLNLMDQKRPMVGQAPYVVNAGIQHTLLENKLNINALYNRVGRRLVIASGAIYPSVWDVPRDVIDLQLSLKILKSKGELKLNAGDLLNQSHTLYYDVDRNKQYLPAADQTLSSFKMGRNYSLSFAYTF